MSENIHFSQPSNKPEKIPNTLEASKIYILPNLMTAGNLFCGFASSITCIHASYALRQYETITGSAADLFKQAVWLILGAIVFDALDGRLARIGKKESLFGAEFDSLADVVSFGLTPALMVYFLITYHAEEHANYKDIGWIVSFIYLLCAAIRLARFNVITHPLLQRTGAKSNYDFVGLPVPFAAVTIAAMILLMLTLDQNSKSYNLSIFALSVLLLLVSFLMISTVLYPSGKKINFTNSSKIALPVIAVIVVTGTLIFREYAILGLCFAYLLYGLFRHGITVLRRKT
jgi:CDP-diacylglycerol---serine O-phosphatidyltransferase